jgi:hypothetical protein
MLPGCCARAVLVKSKSERALHQALRSAKRGIRIKINPGCKYDAITGGRPGCWRSDYATLRIRSEVAVRGIDSKKNGW